MKQRILGAAILVVLLVPALIIGGTLFKAVVALIACGSVYELIKTTNKKAPTFIYVLGMLSVLFYIFIEEIKTFIGAEPLFMYPNVYISLIALVLLVPCLFVRDKYGANDAIKLIGITILLGEGFTAINRFYFGANIYYLLFIVFIAVTTDVFALFGGMLIGKHKLTPISPKKTIEGSVVGLICCTIITTTYYMIAIKESPLYVIIPIIMVLSIVGQMGDLFFSLIKRENDTKDYSHLIPGHGGLLDRFDSLLFIALALDVISEFL